MSPAIRPEARELDFFRRNENLLVGLVLVIALLPFVRLGDTDLEYDEGMWALRGKAVAEHNAWMDQTPYSFKRLYSGAYPPLFFWVMGGSMKVLGAHPNAARLPSAIFGFATVILIFFIARKTYGFRSAVLAAIVFGLSHRYLDYAQTAEMDITYVFWVTLAVYLYMRYQRGSGRAIVILPMAGMATGMAFLTKPLLGFYVPLILLPYLFYMTVRERYGWKRAVIDLLVLALGAFAVAGFWHGTMGGRYPEPDSPGDPKGFWHWLVQRNIVDRAAGPMEGHTSGWGYLFYINAIVNYFPFVFALGVVGLADTLRMLSHKLFYRPRSFPGTAAGAVSRVHLSVDDRMRLLILIWLVVTLVVPSAFGSKVTKYGLMAMVPFAILAGVAIDRVYRGASSRETNVALFAWTVVAVVYWQTHQAQHALEALVSCLIRLQPLGPGEFAILYDGGTFGLTRVVGAGLAALALAIGAWSLRNRLSVSHERVGRAVIPLILGPMLILAVWRVAAPADADSSGRDPLAADRAWTSARTYTERKDAAHPEVGHAKLSDFELAQHVIVVGHWRDNFQMAFYLNAINAPGTDWRPALEHSCLRDQSGSPVPEFVRIESHDETWQRYDLGLEKAPVELPDPFAAVNALASDIRRAGESVLIVFVLYDGAFAQNPARLEELVNKELRRDQGFQAIYPALLDDESLTWSSRRHGFALLYSPAASR